MRISREQTGQVFPARNIQTVEPGDFVWVPEVKDVDTWQVFKDVLMIAGQAAVVIVTVARL